MPVVADLPYPSLSYYTTDRPALHGFSSRYRTPAVYAEPRAERTRRVNSQRDYYTYPTAHYNSGSSRPRYAPRPDGRTLRRRSSLQRTRVTLPTPGVTSYPAGPDPGYPSRRARSPPRNYSSIPQAPPSRHVRFQSPQSIYRYTPAPSFPTPTTTTTSATPTPMRMPEPEPYPINPPAPMNVAPQYRPRQSQAPVMPFPDSRFSKPLPPTPSTSSDTPLGSSEASTYGSPYGSSSGFYGTTSSSRSSRTRYPRRGYHISPSIFGSSNSSTYGGSSFGTPPTPVPPGRVRDKSISLRKASERMGDFKREADLWMSVIRRKRGSRLTSDEAAVVSLVRDLVQRSKTALETIDVILASLAAYEGIGNGSPFSSEKLKADTYTLATIGTSLHHKLAALTKRLKNAEARAGETPPDTPDCCTAMNLPGCIASLYLKKRLFRFTSLLKAHKEQYSEMGPEKLERFGPYAPPRSTLIGSLYSEVQGAYNSAAAALAGFESSLRSFQLDLQSQVNQRYMPMTIG